ncbi:MAG: hypothetical protein JSU73_13210 [candidate division WOR-3 bacterium]|nr:MAG: hypothetical protein JSU73_13210 [candidate division WOR-3 bacterium]
MRYLNLIALLLVLAAVAADETDSRSVKEILNQATEFYRDREYGRAVELYETVLDSIKDDAHQLYNAACTYSLAGEKQRAIELLKLTIEAGWDDYDHMARDTDLDNIRDEPEYKALVADLKQKAEERERGYKFWLNPGETKVVNGHEFELVGLPTDTVPESARSIRDLHPFNGELYLGYGDGMANKGPVAIVSFQPGELDWCYHFMAQEHLVARFRDIGDELFIPGAEPFEGIPGRNYLKNYDFGNIFRLFPSGGFVKYRTVPVALHIQDIAKLGPDYFCTAGTASEGWQKAWGAIFRSTDGCVTWTSAHDLEGPEEAVTRLGIIRPFRDRLWAFGFAFTVDADNRFLFTPDAFGKEEAIVYDGKAWSTQDLIQEEGLLTVLDAEEFDGRLVINAGFYDPEVDTSPPAVFSKLYAYSGQGKADKVLDRELLRISDMFVDGEWLYLLIRQGDGRRVLRTRDLAEFETEVELSEELGAGRIAVLDGFLYLGGRKGEVYRVRL